MQQTKNENECKKVCHSAVLGSLNHHIHDRLVSTFAANVANAFKTLMLVFRIYSCSDKCCQNFLAKYSLLLISPELKTS